MRAHNSLFNGTGVQGGHEAPQVPGTGQQGNCGGMQLGPGGFI